MQQPDTENIFAAARDVKLSSEEKAHGRARLAAFMGLKPVRAAQLAEVMSMPEKQDASADSSMARGWFALHRGLAIASLVGAVTLSVSGVSYAAESALPGDALYPVKVVVNEEVRSAFARTDKERADWEADRAERRLSEAEKLEEQGRLDDARRAEIQKRYDTHAERARAQVTKLRELQDDGPGRADEVEARLEGAIAAHERIMEAIAADHPERTSKPIISRPAAKEEAAGAEDKSEKDDGRYFGLEAAAQARRATAVRFINHAKEYLASVQADLDVEALTAAKEAIASADAAVLAGNSLLGKDPKGAAMKFLEAQKIALETRLLIRARAELDVKIDVRHDRGSGDVREQKDKDDGARESKGRGRERSQWHRGRHAS